MDSSVIDLEALLSVPSVVDYDISKSKEIVFASNKSGQFQLYLGKLTDEGMSDYEQLTTDEESKTAPKFSPDCTKILYASDYHGDENFNLFLYNIQGKNSTRLTNLHDTTIYPNANFSKDGKKIAYVSNNQEQFATYVLDLVKGHTSRISYHSFPDEYATISPDSKFVAFSSHLKAQDEGIFIASLENPSSGVVKLEVDGSQIDASQPVWSPDSKKVVFVSSLKGMYDIGVWSVDSRKISWLTKFDRECSEPAFSNDGKKIAYTVNTGGDIKLVVYEFEGGKSTILEFRHGIVTSPKFSLDDRTILFLFEGARNPCDLWMYTFEDEKFVQLTESLPDNIEVSNFVEGEQISYRSEDGLKIPALIYMPNKSASISTKKAPKRARGRDTRENLPAVIEIHGGPTWQALNGWSPFVQVLVARGFLVLRPNYRGSTGFGKDFREANRFVMGHLDLSDCASGRDFLVQRHLADPKRIAVTGGSFGGYLTMCCLAKYPEYWSCGAALVPFLNWFTEIKNEREELRFWDLQNMGDPEKDEERLRNASPIFFMDKVKAPVLLIAGKNDSRCPLEESVQAKEELQKLGRQVEFSVYEDEGHGFRKTKNKVDAYTKTISFVEKNISRHISS